MRPLGAQHNIHGCKDFRIPTITRSYLRTVYARIFDALTAALHNYVFRSDHVISGGNEIISGLGNALTRFCQPGRSLYSMLKI